MRTPKTTKQVLWYLRKGSKMILGFGLAITLEVRVTIRSQLDSKSLENIEDPSAGQKNLRLNHELIIQTN